MKIRPLHNADWELWKNIRLEALQNSPENFGSSYEEEKNWTDADFQKALTSSHVWGAFVDQVLVSCAGFYVLHSLKTKHRGVLWGVYTRPDFRGKGIATALIQTLIQNAKTCVSQLHLTCVTTNHIASSWYQKQGFKIYGTEPKALKVQGTFYDEYLMLIEFGK